MNEIRAQAERCLAKLKAGELGEGDLQELLALTAAAAEAPRRQSLLYIQAPHSHPYSQVVGMSIFEDGKDSEGVDEKGEFLYKSIYDALRDGWRIVKFPEMTLAMDDQNTYALGYEFILERWR